MSGNKSDRWNVSRRRAIRTVGGAGLIALAGCSRDGGADIASEASGTTKSPKSTATRDRPTETTEAATETATETATPTESVDTEALESKLSDRSFKGRLFDTHAHWAGARSAGHTPLDPESFANRMKENDVGACVLFTSSVEVAQQYPTVLQQLVNSNVEYIPFLQPQNRSHLVKGDVTDVYAEHPTAFMGIGEIIFYGGPMQGTSLTADPWPALFTFSADNDVPLMIHPTQAQEDGLKTMLSNYPNATVMGHGGEFNLAPKKLLPLLRNHENLYWTIDAGSMLNGLVLTAADASEFASRYDERKKEFNRLVKQILPPILDAAPSRVMWGTDLATNWNTDPEVYSRIMDWTQTALDSLPSDQQDKYAYKNAKQLFGI